jgi:hypothetical protein
VRRVRDRLRAPGSAKAGRASAIDASGSVTRCACEDVIGAEHATVARLSARPADRELRARSKDFPETGDEQACPIIHALWLTLHVKDGAIHGAAAVGRLRTIAGETMRPRDEAPIPISMTTMLGVDGRPTVGRAASLRPGPRRRGTAPIPREARSVSPASLSEPPGDERGLVRTRRDGHLGLAASGRSESAAWRARDD